MKNMDFLSFEQIAMLKDVEDESGRLLVKPIVDLYLKNTEERVLEMMSLLNLGERKEVLRIAHTLKSSSATIGANKIWESCFTIENLLLRDADVPSIWIHVMINEILNDCPETFRQLRELLNKNYAATGADFATGANR